MSLGATSFRISQQTSYISDLEYAINQIAQKQMQLTYQAQAAEQTDPQAAEFFQMQSKQLELEMKSLDTQMKVASAEMDGLKKMQEDGVKRGTYLA